MVTAEDILAQVSGPIVKQLNNMPHAVEVPVHQEAEVVEGALGPMPESDASRGP